MCVRPPCLNKTQIDFITLNHGFIPVKSKLPKLQRLPLMLYVVFLNRKTITSSHQSILGVLAFFTDQQLKKLKMRGRNVNQNSPIWKAMQYFASNYTSYKSCRYRKIFVHIKPLIWAPIWLCKPCGSWEYSIHHHNCSAFHH